MQFLDLRSGSAFLAVSVLSLVAMSSCDNSKCVDIVPLNDVQVSPSNLVSVNFRVVRCGDDVPVGNLPITAFKIVENGQEVSRYESRQRFNPEPLTYRAVVSLLLDLSGSVLDTLDTLKSAAKSAVQMLIPTNDAATLQSRQISVTAFNGSEKLFYLGNAGGSSLNTTNSLLSAIDAIHCSNPIKDSDPEYCKIPTTNLYGAFKSGVQDLDREVHRLTSTNTVGIAEGSLVTFTDGRDRANWATFNDAYSALSSADTKPDSYTIGLGSEIDTDVLKRLGRTGFFPAPQAAQLGEAFQSVMIKILDRANSVYAFEYCSPINKGDVELQLVINDQGRSGDHIFHFTARYNGETCPLFKM